MSKIESWDQRIGRQRDWIWRGWQIRYTYFRSSLNLSPEPYPPLILLHGFGAAIEHWRNNIPTLAQQHTVYALDLLGFGGSRKAATDYSVYLWAELVYDFWQTFIGEPVILVGNSIGSLVCLTAADNYPNMVIGIVMLSLPDISLRQEMIPRWLQPVVTIVENLVASPLLFKGLLKIIRRPSIMRLLIGLAYEDSSAITDELVEIIMIPAYDEGASRTLCSLVQGAQNPNFAPSTKSIIPKLTIPMLLIWGSKDRLIPSSLAPIFAKLNSRITSIELDKIGHCPHDECPEQFNSILLNWSTALNSKSVNL